MKIVWEAWPLGAADVNADNAHHAISAVTVHGKLISDITPLVITGKAAACRVANALNAAWERGAKYGENVAERRVAIMRGAVTSGTASCGGDTFHDEHYFNGFTYCPGKVEPLHE